MQTFIGNDNGQTFTVSVTVPGPTYQPSSSYANQFFDRLITPPTIARATLYSALINTLVIGNVWQNIDALYIFATTDIATALINLKSNLYQATLIQNTGLPIFTIDRGFSGCGGVQYQSINPNFNPSITASAGSNYQQNNALIDVWMLGSTMESQWAIRDLSGNAVEILPYYSGNRTAWNINGTEQVEANTTGPAGHWLVQRTATNASALYRDGVQLSTSSNNSQTLVNEYLYFDPIANTIAAGVIGSSLTSSQITILDIALRTYLTAIGAI